MGWEVAPWAWQLLRKILGLLPCLPGAAPLLWGSETWCTLSKAGSGQILRWQSLPQSPPHIILMPLNYTLSPSTSFYPFYTFGTVPTCPSFRRKILFMHSSGRTCVLVGLKPLSQRWGNFSTPRKNKMCTGPVCFPMQWICEEKKKKLS